jgi:hypothetical protein
LLAAPSFAPVVELLQPADIKKPTISPEFHTRFVLMRSMVARFPPGCAAAF